MEHNWLSLWDQEYAFFSADAPHGLADAWLTCLSRDQVQLDAARSLVESEPAGRPGRWPRKRLDYIFVSSLNVLGASYDQRARERQLTDHALHLATLAAVGVVDGCTALSLS